MFFNVILAQSKNNKSQTAFQAEVDSLNSIKSSLLQLNESLKSEIDSLNFKIERNIILIKECEYQKLVKKYGKKSGGRVASGSIWKGMTEQMLIDSWGKPDKITSKKEKWGTFTQYYYGDVTFFFKNKALIDWEEKANK